MNASFSEARIDLFSRLGTAVKMYGALSHFLVFLALDPWIAECVFREVFSLRARRSTSDSARIIRYTLFEEKTRERWDGMTRPLCISDKNVL